MYMADDIKVSMSSYVSWSYVVRVPKAHPEVGAESGKLLTYHYVTSPSLQETQCTEFLKNPQ